MTCSCTWAPLPASPVATYLARRDPACVTHGDSTKWWAGVQARTAALAVAHGVGQ